MIQKTPTCPQCEKLLAILARLIEWDEHMGTWEAPVWRDAKDLHAELAGKEPPAEQEADETEMTVESFQASRRYVEDLGEFCRDATLLYVGGYLYLDSFYIDDTSTYAAAIAKGNESWPEGISPGYVDRGRWHLLIDREEYVSNDLAELERRLFEWALKENDLPAGP
jgi:hypothetical protein